VIVAAPTKRIGDSREDHALAKIEHRLNYRSRGFARDEMSGDGGNASFVALREVARDPQSSRAA